MCLGYIPSSCISNAQFNSCTSVDLTQGSATPDEIMQSYSLSHWFVSVANVFRTEPIKVMGLYYQTVCCKYGKENYICKTMKTGILGKLSHVLDILIC